MNADWVNRLGTEAAAIRSLSREFQENLYLIQLMKQILGCRRKNAIEQCQPRFSREKWTVVFNCEQVEAATVLIGLVEELSLGIYEFYQALKLPEIPQAVICVRGEQVFPRWNPKRFLKRALAAITNSKPDDRSQIIIVPQLSLDLQTADNDEFPVYLTEVDTQVIRYANRAALQANSREPEQMIDKDCIALWDDSILCNLSDDLVNPLNNGRLTDYSYQGYRWFTDESNRTWRRMKMWFTSDYFLIFGGLDYPIPSLRNKLFRYCRIKGAVPCAEGPVLQMVG